MKKIRSLHVTPQFRPSWTRPNRGIILENYSLEYSLSHTVNADLNPLGGIRRQTHKLNLQCMLIQRIIGGLSNSGSYYV